MPKKNYFSLDLFIKVEYKLSDLGNTMHPIIVAMEKWGLDYKQCREAND
ncbi:MAG: winged helix-turn-helix transcriptional regulator [Negativicutes bacterium]